MTEKLIDVYKNARNIVSNPNITFDEWVALSEHENYRIRNIVLSEYNIDGAPTEIVDKMVWDTHDDISARAYLHSNISDKALRQLKTDPRDTVVKKVIQSLSLLDKRVWEELIHHVNPTHREALVNHYGITPKLLHYMAVSENNKNVLYKIISKRKTSQETLIFLTGHSAWEIRQALVSQKNISEEILLILKDDEKEQVREQVYVHPNFPQHLIPEMVNKEHTLNMFRRIAGIKNLPEETYIKLFFLMKEECEKTERNIIFDVFLQNRTVPTSLLKIIYNVGVPDLDKALFVKHPNADHEIVSTIYEATKTIKSDPFFDQKQVLLQAIAGSVHATPEMLTNIFETKDHKADGLLADNPNTPPVILRTLFTQLKSKVSKTQAVYWLAIKDPTFKDWPLEWVETHFGLKFTRREEQQIIEQREGNQNVE